MRKIKFLVMDVDGTLTDGKIYMGPTGEALKAFDIKDGCGIKEILPKYGIIPIVITARESPMLELRCKELGIKEFHQGCREKMSKLQEIVERLSTDRNYDLSNIAYMGDDFLDLQCMIPVKEAGGMVVCPNDAIKKVKKIADFISTRNAGNGAVREFIEWYVSKIEGCGFDKVRQVSEEAYKFLINFEPSKVLDGRYELDRGVFANVMTYMTKPSELTMYESHKRYIDIQYLVYGKELMALTHICNLDGCVKKYDSINDVVLYKYESGEVVSLEAGDIIILHPEEAHRGGIGLDNLNSVRKIVIKVPV